MEKNTNRAEYKIVKTEQDKDFVIKNPKFWNVMIDETWYILMVE